MSEDTTDQPVVDDAQSPAPGVDQPEEHLQPLIDADPENPDNLPDEDEEVDFEGNKYKVPKPLKDALLRQADYTRKTQEVADQRKALEGQQQQLRQQAEQQQAFLGDVAGVTALERQLAQYAEPGKDIDWNALRTYDQVNGTQHAQDALILQNQLGQAKNSLFTKMQQRDLEQQRATAKQLEERDATLSKEIRGWSPELRGKVEELGAKFGFSKAEIDTSDARAFKILHRLYLGEQAISREMKTRSLQAAQATQPAPTVRGAAPAVKDPDKMNADEWQKWRNKQIADQRKKAG